MSEEEKLAEQIKTLTQTHTNKIYELQSRLEKTQLLWADFAGVQKDLELIDIKNDHSASRISFEDTFFDSTGAAKGFIDKYFMSLSQQNVPVPQNIVFTNPNTSSNNTNLPKIKLPEFYGSYDKWLQFADTYKSLVHNNASLSNIERFWYLKSCIKGDAANALNALEVSETNYDKAWDILCDRYQNKRIIIQTHLKAIFAIQPITKESHLLFRNLIDTLMQHLRALESLGLPVDSWDAILIFHISSKLDTVTRREWEDISLKLPTDTPSIKDLISFLNKRCQVLENINSNNSVPSKDKNKFDRSAILLTTDSVSCFLCKKEHPIFSCPDFLKLSPQERLNKIRKIHACTNCLRQGHLSKDCNSTHSCKKCSGRHNTLLHLFANTNSYNSVPTNQTKNSNQHTNLPHSPNNQMAHSPNNQMAHSPLPDQNHENKSETFVNHSQSFSITDYHSNQYIILSTANVLVFDSYGKAHCCRALLDNCSQSNFITQELLNKLSLPTTNISHSVEGFGNNLTKVFKSTSISLKSTVNSFTLNNINFLVTEKITKNLPEISFDSQHLQIPKNITLADNDFNKSKPIDMLIGASIFWNLLCIGQIVLANNCTILQKTKLGWIVSGPLPLHSAHQSSICNLSIGTCSISNQLEKFWQIEECQTKTFNSKEEDECEEHFLKTTTRDTSGRFIISLPLKDNVIELGNSSDNALKRFHTTEKRLNRNPELRSKYNNFMLEYEKLGHMSKIETFNNSPNCQEFYLPHHGVIKESRSTTKLRVVFDGSAKSASGLCLNDTLKVGPKIQDDLMDIVIRFRTHNFVFTADIEKMYRCVMVQENQRNLQKILWRYDSSDKIDHYQLNTVTYGTSSAAFLAVRCLQQLAVENKDKFPNACDVISSCFYVDDLLSGSETIEQGKQLISEITQILQTAEFNLRKWVATDPILLSDISKNECTLSQKVISDDKTVKTLGLIWNSQKDVFQYSVHISQNERVTKRSILATTAQIFDPMGLIGPCIIKAKLVLQTLWQLGLNWDESVPAELHSSWISFCNQLPNINDIEIPRHILVSSPLAIELHGFSDASQRAYGACCYLRSFNSSGVIQISLICAKSRVAPLKTLSLPRLELCAAVLLSSKDSTIVLAWILHQPNQLNTFVANRISEIQQCTQVNQWHHIPSENNPADIISRGLEPNKLKTCHLWWSGPAFLTKDEEHWPKNTAVSLDPPEVKQTKLTLIASVNDNSFIKNYSSFTRLQRTVAFCLRFIHNSRTKSSQLRYSGPLSRTELNKSTVILCKIIQSHYFSDEIKCLKEGVPLSSKSNILRLNPFLDENNLIRVGGRPKYSNCLFGQKHPILLPNQSHLTKLIILYEHLRYLHAGAQATLSAVRLNFWPINGRSIVQRVLRTCIICFRINPTTSSYQMGDLPKSRVTVQHPFYTTGIDFAGPFLIKDGKAKNRTLVKCYLCIFVCFTTKAAHFELAGDLSSESFLNCLKRFISRRGICSEIYSDNGTNFIGTKNELEKVIHAIKNNSNFLDFLSLNHITWHFSPPHGPNFGGLWEACVKSAKFHLKRIVGNAHLTYEALSTVFIQIEAVLNSRPLLPLSNDPNDLNALTPSHFLIGTVLTALPQDDVKDIPENRLSHFKRLQQQVQHFWQRWSNQYLSILQERSKWNKSFPNIKVGTLVIIKDDGVAPLCWKLGRITNVFPGKDKIVRVVDIKTNSGILRRPVSKVCVLPMNN